METLSGVIGLLVILAIPGLWGIWYVLTHAPEDESEASSEEKSRSEPEA